MRYRILFFSFLILVLLPCQGYGETSLEVGVHGVEGKLHDNIMARLRINVFSRNSSLSEVEVRRLHRLAPTDIEAALAPFGFYSPEIDSELTKTETGWLATYHIQPGDPVLISNISVSVTGEGAGLPEFVNPERLFDLTEGAVLNQPGYERGKRTLIRKANALGFLDASFIVHQIRINRTTKEAEIELVLDSGRRFLFGDTVSEQDIISEELLTRFLPYERGDHFISGKLHELQRDLNQTDFFGMVVVEADTSDKEEKYVPVKIRLEPRENYNRYSFGVGYATDTRAHVLFEWQNRLLNRRGHHLNSSFLLGEQESHVVIRYKIPVADPRHNTVGLNGLWNRERWEDTITSSLSAGLTYEYVTRMQHVGISLEALNEDYRVGETTGTSQLLIPGIQGSWALADDVINTRNGIRGSLHLSGADKNLFSDATFFKARADGRVILSLIESWRLIGRGSIGAILVDSIDDIPPSLRFYAGGQKSVRGYRYRSLGPTDSSGTVIGGTFLITGSIECERRISEIWRAAAFYDVGNAMDDFSADLVHGAGVGVGVVLPFGQARLELAYPLNDEGSSQYVFLSVGADL